MCGFPVFRKSLAGRRIRHRHSLTESQDHAASGRLDICEITAPQPVEDKNGEKIYVREVDADPSRTFRKLSS